MDDYILRFGRLNDINIVYRTSRMNRWRWSALNAEERKLELEAGAAYEINPVGQADLKQGLLPIIGSAPTVLILGSFPSARARAEEAYYANPQNHFWPIIEELFGIRRTLPYPERARLLADRQIALWDMVDSCHQEGSMDSTIQEPALHDIRSFLMAHSTIRLVVTNGRTAERFLKRSLGTAGPPPGVTVISLPSTSPANAREPFQKKVQRWQMIRDWAPLPSYKSDDPEGIGRSDLIR